MYIDGHERTTKLPNLHRGSTLIFDTEVLQSGKVRVTIEVDDKIATFDWSVEKSNTPTASPLANSLFFAASESKEDVIKLYFAMKFAGEDWKIGVE